MKSVRSTCVLAVIAASTALGSIASAQVSLTSGSPTYTQDFNTLPNTTNVLWADNSTLPSWYAQRAAGTMGNIIVGTGSSNAGGIYSFGAASGDTDRALGTLWSSGTGNWLLGLRMKNDNATNITDISVTYTAEQWRHAAATSNDAFSFFYKVSASPITGITATEAGNPGGNGFTAVVGLNSTTPLTGGTGVAVVGNLPANQNTVTLSFPVIVPPGSEIMLAWLDSDTAGGADSASGLDALSVTATFAAGGSTWSTTALGATFNDGGHTPVDAANGPFQVTATVNATGTTVIDSVTGLSAPFSFSGAVPPLGSTLNNGDSQVFTFVYNPASNTGLAEAQQTATLNATTGSPASATFTLDGGTVRQETIANWRTYVEAGNPVAGIKWKLSGTVGSNTLRPSPTQNVITVQDRVDGDSSTRGFYVFDNSAQGGSLPAVGTAVSVYGTAVKFQGLWELVPDRPHVSAGITPTVTPVTVAANAIGDAHESVLIRVNSASVATGTTVVASTLTTFTTASGNLDVQVFSDNTTVNQGIVANQGYDIMGIGYQSDSANNFNSGGVGYRLLPRLNSDFITPATSVSTWSMY